MTATVFGSTGFAARYIINRLGRVGSQVICPYRGDGFSSRHLKLMGDVGQIVPLPYDFSDVESVENVVNRSNVVINCLGAQLETTNYSFDDANVKTTYRICKIAKEQGVNRFIHISSVLADENSPSAWARSKAAGEKVVKDFFPDATILRTTQLYGYEDKFLNRLADIIHYSPIYPLVDGGHAKLQPTYVGDLSKAVINAIGMPEAVGQTYHLGGNEVLTQEDLAHYVMQTIFKGSNVMEVPREIANLYGYAYEFVPPRWRVFTRDMIVQAQMDQTIRRGISTKTFEDLKVEPVNFYNEASRTLIHHRQDRALSRHGIVDNEEMIPQASQFWEGKEGDYRFRKFN